MTDLSDMWHGHKWGSALDDLFTAANQALDNVEATWASSVEANTGPNIVDPFGVYLTRYSINLARELFVIDGASRDAGTATLGPLNERLNYLVPEIHAICSPASIEQAANSDELGVLASLLAKHVQEICRILTPRETSTSRDLYELDRSAGKHVDTISAWNPVQSKLMRERKV